MNPSFTPTTPEALSAGAMVAGLTLLVILCTGIGIDIRLLHRWKKTGIPPPPFADAILKRHWHWRDGVWLILVMTVFLAAVALTGRLLEAPISHLSGTLSRILIIVQNLLTQGLALGLVIYLQRRSGYSFTESLGGNTAPLRVRLRQAIIFYLAAMPGIALAAMVANALFMYRGAPLQPQPVLSGFIDTTAPFWFKGWLIATAVITAPIVEETVFRGVFFPAVAKHRGIPAGIVMVALLFAFIHGHPPAALPLFVVGTTLATAYLYTGSLMVPILIHSIFNSINLLALLMSGITYTP